MLGLHSSRTQSSTLQPDVIPLAAILVCENRLLGRFLSCPSPAQWRRVGAFEMLRFCYGSDNILVTLLC